MGSESSSISTSAILTLSPCSAYSVKLKLTDGGSGNFGRPLLSVSEGFFILLRGLAILVTQQKEPTQPLVTTIEPALPQAISLITTPLQTQHEEDFIYFSTLSE